MGTFVSRTLLGRGTDLDQQEALRIVSRMNNRAGDDDRFELTATDSSGDSVTLSLSGDELREAAEEILKVVKS